MKKCFGLIACIFIACFVFVGCDVTFMPNVRFETQADDGAEIITFSGSEFVEGELESEISIDKPESQQGEDDKVTSAGQPYNSATA